MALSTGLLITMVLAVIFMALFVIGIILLVFIKKKTHAITEFKAYNSKNPLMYFFDDNKYFDVAVAKHQDGVVDSKEHGSFIIDQTYVDKKTKLVVIPVNPASYAVSINVKGAKYADDLSYLHSDNNAFRSIKKSVLSNKFSEVDGSTTLRTSIDFSKIKNFVSPILPQNVKSIIEQKVFLRTGGKKKSISNIVLMIIAAIGAIVLGGLVLNAVAF